MKKLIIILVLLSGINLNAQREVNSNAYSLMLKTLLSHTVPEVSVDSAMKTTDSNTVWLDAREPNEIKVSTIKNSIPVGYDHFDISSVDSIPKNSEIIVYCSVGYRSEKVAEKLITGGFTDVSNLYGGIFEWVNREQTTYHDSIPTLNIHAYNRLWGEWLNKGVKVYTK
ncbi:MAG: rhodanese-related sulfurtransferase [Glaciecola sp.]|jgi:rhodanese-related sulfurtransferase